MSLDFTTPAGLRMLLTELHYAGPDAWRDDPAAVALITYATDKYAALAHRHHLSAEDAAYAAFHILRTTSVRLAHDPWAVVTRAVQISLIAEERANGLLCSTHQARRPEISANHDAERFSDRETSILEYHPAFHQSSEIDVILADTDQDRFEPVEPKITVTEAFELTVRMFIALDWPEPAIRHAIEYIAAKLDGSNRVTAHETLRRDPGALRALDLPQPSWSTLLTVVLGNPHTDYEHTKKGHGIWWRLLVGESPLDILAQDDLVTAIITAAPRLDAYDRVERMLAHVA